MELPSGIGPLRRSLTALLRDIYPDAEASAIAFSLLESVAGLSRASMLARPGKELTAVQHAGLHEALKRLLAGEPIQYVLGRASFCEREFLVSPDVLIPRPETEELVAWVLEDAQEREGVRPVLDIGTGSACIAISLALGNPSFQCTATDVSEPALGIARQNAARLGAGVRFLRHDILLEERDGLPGAPFSIIVSNPPYVTAGEAADMMPHVLGHEPHLALFVPDDDPLVFYEAILLKAREGLLDPEGTVYFEINEALGEELSRLAISLGFTDVVIRHDIHGKPRMARLRH